MEQSADKLERNIKTAYDIVKRLDIVEPDLLKEAFVYALGSLSSNLPPLPIDRDGADIGQTADTAYELIARGLDISVDTIELIYDVNGGEVTLNLPPKSLPDSTSAAMREIGVLLAVGIKCAQLGSGAPFELIRTACSDHGKLDKKNFAAAMSGMKPRLSVIGKGADRELIPKRPAEDWARELITRYAQNLK